MTTQSLSQELAAKQPANAPARSQSQVIDGQATQTRTRPVVPGSHLGLWVTFLIALLFTGFLLSMWQQAS